MVPLINNILCILSNFKSKTKDNDGGSISLEALNNKIRFAIWLFLFCHVTMNTIFSATRLALWVYLLVYSTLFGSLLLLVKCKNEVIKGIPFLLLNLGVTLALVQKGENFFLRIMTISLPSLPIYSIQGYSPLLLLAMGTGHFMIYKQYNHYLEVFYEPITSTYRIPAISIENTLIGWRVGLIFEIICLMTYQIVVQKLWKNYKKAKLNLEETNQKLQAVNLELAKNFEEQARLNKQLHDALQSQDLFVACVSHELRNPLNVMLGSLDLIESQIKDESQIQILKTCRVCGDALLSQINNLLDVAKINADKLEISEFATNMGTFLERFWAYTRISLEKKTLNGHLAVDKRLPLWLNIDEHRLQQILNNLIGNAVKFTTEGSVRVKFNWVKGNRNHLVSLGSIDETLTKGKSTLTAFSSVSFGDEESSNEMLEGKINDTYTSVILHKNDLKDDFLYFKPSQSVKNALESILDFPNDTQDHILKIDIVDTGCGISEEVQQKIFEPFVQGDRSITRKYGGTGLGLYIVKSLVTKMGGNLKITSIKDVGTHFQITLPAKPVRKGTNNFRNTENNLSLIDIQGETPSKKKVNQSTSLHNTFAADQLKLMRKKALIVDDDAFNRSLLREYFKKLNFDSDIAHNGLEAVQMYKANHGQYAFITMDIQMPIMDGITACKQIRAFEDKANRTRIPIIISTANCSEAEQRACLLNKEIGANYFFRKPFSLSDCKLCIEKIVGGI